MIGQAPFDGKTYLRLGTRCLEFDTPAMTYYASRGDDQKATIARGLSVSSRYQFSDWDLKRIVSGEVVKDEDVFPRVTRMPKGEDQIKFWTRSEFAGRSTTEQYAVIANAPIEFRAWLINQTVSQVFTFVGKLLAEGADIIADHGGYHHTDDPAVRDFVATRRQAPRYLLAAMPTGSVVREASYEIGDCRKKIRTGKMGFRGVAAAAPLPA